MFRRVLIEPTANFPCPTSGVPLVKEISTPTTAAHAIRQASLPGGEPELVDVLDPDYAVMLVMDNFCQIILRLR